MSRFLTPTDVRVLRGEFRDGRQLFQLLADVQYESDLLKGVVTVPVGYITDFSSVPRLPLAYLVAGATANEAAVIHDWLYTSKAHDGKAITRAMADAVFKEAIKASEDTQAPAWLMWLAVRVGGGAWDDEGPLQLDHIEDILSAEVEAP